MWYHKFSTLVLKLGYMRSEEDHCVYIKVVDDQILIIILCVHGMRFIGNNKVMIKELKAHLFGTFDMYDLEAATYILGMETNRDLFHKFFWLSHIKYVDTIL